MNTKEDVLDFIHNFSKFGTDVVKCFTEDNCYWFANILYHRFGVNGVNDISIMYNAESNHFAFFMNAHLYDITGEITEGRGKYVEWFSYFDTDPTHFKRIYKQCVLKEYNN